MNIIQCSLKLPGGNMYVIKTLINMPTHSITVLSINNICVDGYSLLVVWKQNILVSSASNIYVSIANMYAEMYSMTSNINSNDPNMDHWFIQI